MYQSKQIIQKKKLPYLVLFQSFYFNVGFIHYPQKCPCPTVYNLVKTHMVMEDSVEIDLSCSPSRTSTSAAAKKNIYNINIKNIRIYIYIYTYMYGKIYRNSLLDLKCFL